MAPLQAEINQLNRQFWVTKVQVKANKYDLSASRYRQIEQDEPFYESPQVIPNPLKKATFRRDVPPERLYKVAGCPKRGYTTQIWYN